MKHILLLITALLMLGEVQAQVTIGSGIEPRAGALLDLKENNEQSVNSTKGLSLPRVQLTTLSSLDAMGTGLDKAAHIGLTIYVPEAFEYSCPGVYVWSGTEWRGLYTDNSQLPETITLDDVDGNEYTAKLYNRKGCNGGVYWMTSNLRTTRFNDGTPVTSSLDATKPMYFVDAKANTWEYPYDESTTKLHVVRAKSDISTSTAADKMMEFYENGVKQQLTQDQFVTKYGLMYIYNMAFDGVSGAGSTAVKKKLCPEGWKIPELVDWLNVITEVGGITQSEAIRDGANYLGDNTLLEPIDKGIVFAPENIGEDGFVHVIPDSEIPGNGGWMLNVPKPMSTFPTGDARISGLNIQQVGRISTEKPGSSTYDKLIKSWSFGEYAFFLNRVNGTICIRPYTYNGVNQIDAARNEYIYSSVRCIKVVE